MERDRVSLKGRPVCRDEREAAPVATRLPRRVEPEAADQGAADDLAKGDDIAGSGR